MEQWNEIDCHGCGGKFCLFICYLIINKYKERVSFDLDNLEREDGDPDSDEENYNGEDSREFFFLSLLETACLFLETSERWNQNRVIWFIRFTDWRREARLSPTMLRWRNFNMKVGKKLSPKNLEQQRRVRCGWRREE